MIKLGGIVFINMPKNRKMPRRTAGIIHKDIRASGLTHAGPSIKSLIESTAGRFPMEKIIDLGRKIARIPVYVAKDEVLRKNYGKRTAERILRDNAIFASPAGHRHTIEGCVDYATLSVAALRAMGIPARFVRDRRHSYAVFGFGGSIYRFDPQLTYKSGGSDSPVSPVSDMGENERKLNATARKQGRYFEGADPKDIGLDFDSFELPRNKKKIVR